MANDYWKNKRETYSKSDWAVMPSIFAVEVVHYLPKVARILELGAGLGQDSSYFSGLGHKVTATDIVLDGLQKSRKDNLIVKRVDLRKRLPFNDESFDVV